MDTNFDAHKAFEEAHERHEDVVREGGTGDREPRRGARWVPLAASVLAVVAALVSLASNQRATHALILKNEAILLQAKATDAYNFYESRRIKQHTYEAFIDAGLLKNAQAAAAFRKTASREQKLAAPTLKQAQADEHEVDVANERSERTMRSHEILEIAVTLFEIAIVLVSISALVTTPLLSAVAFAFALAGIGVFADGFFLH